MKKLSLLIILLLIFSCAKESRDLTVIANIKGLKKGNVYLKKVKDTVLVTVDSVNVNGDSKIQLTSDLKSPEVFFLYLDKNNSEDDRITFFAEKGVTEINTTLKNFVFDAKITGSKQQKVLEKYRLMMSKFNERNLNLIKENFEAQKDGDSSKYNTVQKDLDNLLKRKYLYTVNFALNNKDSEVAPYLALSEIYNAQVKYLDTIHSSLTSEVKNSLYGKELKAYIEKIKTRNTE